MRFAFYFAHPAQFLFAKNTILKLIDNGHNVLIQIKKKDVLEELLQSSGLSFVNVLPEERRSNAFGAILSLIKRNKRILPELKEFKPDLLISSDASYAQIGKLIKIPCVTILEDDYQVIKPLAILTYPFTSTILCPSICDVGRWNHKKVGYNGYMKLAYLHPNVFQPKTNVIKKYSLPEKYAIIRLASLTAYHDVGIKGISENLLDNVLEQLNCKGITPMISAEGMINSKYDSLLLKIDAKDMHSILASAEILICDSQSMSVESAMLGVPSLRFSSLSGRISVLEELENSYQLTFGFPVDKPGLLLKKLEEILDLEDVSTVFKKRRKKMLDNKIDVTSYLYNFLTNYPITDKNKEKEWFKKRNTATYFGH